MIMAKKQPIKRPGELRNDAEAILWQGRNTNTDKVEELVNELLAEIDRLTAENGQQKATISTLERLALQGGAGHDAIVKKAVNLQVELRAKDKEIKKLTDELMEWKI